MDRDDVAGAEPAVVRPAVRLLRRVVVAGRDPGAAHLELAHRLAVPRDLLVADARADLDEAASGMPAIAMKSKRVSSSASARSCGRRGRRRDGRGLGHAPALHDRAARAAARTPAIIARGTAEPPTSIAFMCERSHVPGFASSSWRMPIQIVGTPAAHVTFSCDEVVEQALRVEVRARVDELRAEHRREVRVAPRVRVEHRHDRQDRVVHRDAEAERVVRADAERVQDGRAVRVDDALRQAGRAARVAHRRGLVLVEAPGRATRPATRVASSSSYESSTTKTCSIFVRSLNCSSSGSSERSTITARSLGVRRDVREVVRVQAQVQRVQDEAAARDAEVRLVVLVVVPAERRDARRRARARASAARPRAASRAASSRGSSCGGSSCRAGA